jgi:hypothetical protein
MSRLRRSLAITCVLAFFLGASAQAAHPVLVVISSAFDASPLPAFSLPSSVPGPLNGEPVSRATARRRPIAVMIDNYSPSARPQSGLARASIVMETLAEGGVTRLMAIYLEKDAPKVGPVRSARVYFERWAAALHAALVHVGGNDDAQALLWQLGPVFNVDLASWQGLFPTGPDPPFWRSADRDPPYNVYVDLAAVRHDLQEVGQNWAYTQAALPHKEPAPLELRGQSGSLTVRFVDPLLPWISPMPDYTVGYQFDRARDSYLRLLGGAPHVDREADQPLRAANVVVMRTGPAVAGPAEEPTLESIEIPMIGSGPAWYFRDGTVTRGTWEQKDQLAPLRFLDRIGRPVAFNPGQTWIEVLPTYSTASWSFHRGHVRPLGHGAASAKRSSGL